MAFLRDSCHLFSLSLPLSLPLSSSIILLRTSANSGLGKEITTYAVSKNAKVYMLCRSKERAEQARQDILNATKECNISDEQNVKILLVR